MLMPKLHKIIYIKDPILKPWWCNNIGLAGLLFRGHLKLEGVGVFFNWPEREGVELLTERGSSCISLVLC